ncbi:aromatic-ring-hydroxylating dioxygenase subunit beta [Ramlibacter henchirensis]|uniref:Aromatic-ring-hydroxylating dioxygenase subunit beta n=1 Tax=Ramlibacter henchirensis TaxID=204072 RepID=A0A4Z0BR26_9BURK|nr:aromatic-ring-hydroxylating dioxygenase subunit beta [Ramlibacter henchirensis]TFZ00850.1 aromatic-ring-hydroxylating dioxygenase subunit beta [Ramlibacter henchirensis]
MTAQEFIAHEAHLLDAQRYDEWLALFAEDGRYWVPLQGAAQTEGALHNSLADEDRLLLSLRIERLKNPRAHSQHPASRCQHLLQAPVQVQADEGNAWRTPFLYIESRGERQVLLAGSYTHRLARVGGDWRIRLKRVDLLDAGKPLPAIQLFP